MDLLQRLSLDETVRAAVGPCSVLEIGCGDGRFLSAMSASLPDADLVGVDISQRRVRKAAVRLSATPRVRLVLASVAALPLPDREFAAAVTVRSFHHWADQFEGLREVSRVLRPGGTFVLADPLASGFIRTPWARRLAELVDGGRFVDAGYLDEMLAAAGLELQHRRPVPSSGGTMFISVARRLA